MPLFGRLGRRCRQVNGATERYNPAREYKARRCDNSPPSADHFGIESVRTLAAILMCQLVFAAAQAHDFAVPAGLDIKRLPVGDDRISKEPKVGMIWACRIDGGGGAQRPGPWMNGDGTYDLTAKAAVGGAVTWPFRFATSVENALRLFASNELPDHPTGNFPVWHHWRVPLSRHDRFPVQRRLSARARRRAGGACPWRWTAADRALCRIAPQRLKAALGPPPPDLTAAAGQLGISVDRLQDALDKSR